LVAVASERTVPRMNRKLHRRRLVLCLASAFGVACAASGGGTEDSGSPLPDSGTGTDATQPKKDAQSPVDSGSSNDAANDVQTIDVFDAGTPPKEIVYGHSPDTLYTFDPTTSSVTKIAAFAGCTQTTLTQVIDLAIDSNMNAFVTTFDGVYSLDLSTAACTLIKTGSYPNSLSFVPIGTLDPMVEALVGYFGSSYVRIDTSTGAITTVGTLTGGYASSGDIVSVKGGGSFLTVTGNGCGDCLLQVDPTTGDMIQDYGALPHGAVYGLGYWAGSLYGFDNGGDIFSIGSGPDGGLATSDIALDGGMMWWGAGSTTIAPVTAADGGAISTK
jgi:hypothetical protein